jgi:phosphoglucomutase
VPASCRPSPACSEASRRLAGRKPAPKEMLIDVARLEREYFERRPDSERSRTRWSASAPAAIAAASLDGTFTEAHILAITQAICDYRRAKARMARCTWARIRTRFRSGPKHRARSLAANGVDTIIQRNNGVTPTPVISRAILAYNRGREAHLADGIVITPSHNPPKDGGFKYNPPNGGPADTDVTQWVRTAPTNCCAQERRRKARAIRSAIAVGDDAPGGLRPALRPRSAERDRYGCHSRRRAQAGGGSAGRRRRTVLGPINAEYKLDIAVVNKKIDPTFSFMTVDHDGVIRMDCSSPYAMARLVGLKDKYASHSATTRTRPARHRHAFGRFDESQSLPCRGHPLSA